MRIKWIDAGKGVAILLVVLGHVLLGLVRSGQYIGYNSTLRFFIELIYAFHMPFFFALSGYFFKPIENIAMWLLLVKNKLIDLGIPYLFFSVILFILQKIGGGEVKNQTTYSQLLNIYKAPIGYLWFLYTLFFIYVLIGLLSIVIKDERVIILVLIIGYIIAAFCNFHIYFIQSTLVWAPMFYFGKLLKGRRCKITYFSWITLIIYLIHVPIFRVMYPTVDYVSQYNPQIWGVFSFIGIYLGFVFVPLLPSYLSNRLARLGLVTLVIYLVHAPAASIIRIILIKIGMTNLIVQIILGIILSLVVSLVSVYFTDKIRVLNFLFYPRKTWIRKK